MRPASPAWPAFACGLWIGAACMAVGGVTASPAISGSSMLPSQPGCPVAAAEERECPTENQRPSVSGGGMDTTIGRLAWGEIEAEAAAEAGIGAHFLPRPLHGLLHG